MRRSLVVIWLLLLALPVQAGAGQPYQQGIEVGMRGERYPAPGQKIIAASGYLTGTDVVDPQRTRLCRIDSIVLDLASGYISYVVVQPGTNDRLIPIPFSAFRATPGKQLVLDIDEGRIYTAPSYPKDAKPDWADPVFSQNVAAFWGTLPAGIATARTQQQQPQSPSTGSK